MDATIKVTVSRDTIVPRDPTQRVAWLEQHGVVAARIETSITLPLATWAQYTPIGVCLDDGGRVEVNHWSPANDALKAACARLLSEDPTAATLPAHLAVSALDAAKAAHETAAQERRARAQADEDARVAANAARVAREREAEELRARTHAEALAVLQSLDGSLAERYAEDLAPVSEIRTLTAKILLEPIEAAAGVAPYTGPHDALNSAPDVSEIDARGYDALKRLRALAASEKRVRLACTSYVEAEAEYDDDELLELAPPPGAYVAVEAHLHPGLPSVRRWYRLG